VFNFCGKLIKKKTIRMGDEDDVETNVTKSNISMTYVSHVATRLGVGCYDISSSIIFSKKYYYFCLAMIVLNIIILIWVGSIYFIQIQNFQIILIYAQQKGFGQFWNIPRLNFLCNFGVFYKFCIDC
jgi:hypothetical protein